MKTINNVEMAFFDVDNTLLCLKMYKDEEGRNDKETGRIIVGCHEYEDWLKYNIFNNAYVHCTAPDAIENLVMKLYKNGAKIYGLTECSNSFEYNAKFNRLKECFPEVFQHHGDLISIDSRHKKVLIMELLAERENIKPEEIMFVDDSYQEIMEAFDHGFFSMHTTEAMERYAD